MAENLGQGVLEKFTAINEEFKAVAADAEADEKEYKDYCESCDKDLAKKLDELSVKIAKMEEHMQYAAEHTSDVETAQIPMDIEREELDDLRRHIDPNSQNDVNADTLYTKASGKKLYYEEEVERTKKKISGSKVQAKRLLDTQLGELDARREKAGEEFKAYISSEEFKNYLTSLSHDAAAFNSSGIASDLGENPAISLGQRRLRLPVPAEFEQELSLSTGGIFNSAAKTIGAPYSIDVASGKVIYVDYDQRNENYMLGGVQRFLVNVLKYYENSVQGIFYADPVRWSSDSLGHIAGLSKGVNSVIDPVAENMEQLVERLNAFRESMTEEDKPLSRVFVFHSFPESYTGEARAVVLDIVRNAEKYKTAVVLTHNSAAEATDDCKAAENTVRAKAEIIRTMNGGFYVEATKESLFWYSAPSDLPEEIRRVFIEQRRRAAAEASAPESPAPAEVSHPVAPASEPVSEAAPAEAPAAEEAAAPAPAVSYKKGDPGVKFCFGSDTAGNKMYYSFTDNGATAFVCGTKRAGRADILHSIIDGIITETHPDDVELWLIDFEGGEFSCYAQPVAPQIRYLVLGGTEELAYSVIDRLCEVIKKRAALFKGKWEKFSDVPADVYMPEIVCVVEGFDEMAEAIAVKEAAYGAKLRSVLLNAKRYGVRVILAGEKFTDNGNTRSYFTGNVFDFRVAMNSADARVAEIFNGLDLSTEDLMSVYNTPDRFAFVNLAVPENNSKIKLASVNERTSADAVKRTSEAALAALSRAVKYDPQDNSVYVFKKCSVKSITARTTFDSVCAAIEDDLSKKAMGVAKLFVGTTGTLTSDHSVDLENIFGSNIILKNPYSCHANAADAVISAARSALMQDCAVEILSAEDSDILKDIRSCESMEGVVIKTDFADICKTISAVKEDITAGNSAERLYILLGGEILLSEMETMGGEVLADGSRNAAADLVFALSQGAKLGMHFLFQMTEEQGSEALRLCKSAMRHRITVTEDRAQYCCGMVTEAFTPYSNLSETEEAISEQYLL